MTIDDALAAMARVDELHNGSTERAAIVEALHRKLLEDPEDFWDAFFEALNNTRPDPTRDLAHRLLKSGTVNGLTTIADIPAILADEYQSNKRDAGR